MGRHRRTDAAGLRCGRPRRWRVPSSDDVASEPAVVGERDVVHTRRVTGQGRPSRSQGRRVVPDDPVAVRRRRRSTRQGSGPRRWRRALATSGLRAEATRRPEPTSYTRTVGRLAWRRRAGRRPGSAPTGRTAGSRTLNTGSEGSARSQTMVVPTAGPFRRGHELLQLGDHPAAIAAEGHVRRRSVSACTGRPSSRGFLPAGSATACRSAGRRAGAAGRRGGDGDGELAAVRGERGGARSMEWRRWNGRGCQGRGVEELRTPPRGLRRRPAPRPRSPRPTASRPCPGRPSISPTSRTPDSAPARVSVAPRFSQGLGGVVGLDALRRRGADRSRGPRAAPPGRRRDGRPRGWQPARHGPAHRRPGRARARPGQPTVRRPARRPASGSAGRRHRRGRRAAAG